MFQNTYKSNVLIPLEKQISLKLSKDIVKKINYLCQIISTVEWSGVLFYTTTGSIKNGSLKIKVEDILPMDKGTTGFTSFAMDNRVIDYLINNNAVEKELKMGLIHSHHNMQSFFSGEDNEELIDGAYTNNIYVSLIVNNRGQKVARVAYSGNPIGKMTSRDEKGNIYTLSLSKTSVIPTALKPVLYHDCIIEEEKVPLNLPDDFLKAVQNILNKPSFQSTKIAQNNFQQKQQRFFDDSQYSDWNNFNVAKKPVIQPNFPKPVLHKTLINKVEEKIFDILIDFCDQTDFEISEGNYLNEFNQNSFSFLFIEMETNWVNSEDKEKVINDFYDVFVSFCEDYETVPEVIAFIKEFQKVLEIQKKYKIAVSLNSALQNFTTKLEQTNADRK